MYVVKIKNKNSNDAMYAIGYSRTSITELRNPNSINDVLTFCMSLEKARKLVNHYLLYSDDYPSLDLEYISIVELSNYAPYSEYAVVFYKEFK